MPTKPKLKRQVQEAIKEREVKAIDKILSFRAIDNLIEARVAVQVIAKENFGLSLHQAIAMPQIQDVLVSAGVEPIGDRVHTFQLEIKHLELVCRVLLKRKKMLPEQQQEEVA